MAHQIISLSFTSLISERWSSFPNHEKLTKEIALAVLAHSELNEEALGLYAPPKEIKEIKVTNAAFDQIQCMWHGHRQSGQQSPPPIPLKIFVFGFGQDASSTWASIEVLPGIDSWEVE
ncbi:hypothetical protein [Hydrocarboniphaga effusa]|jgi:hypothetical protein|uniref:hypothetical protein n=1 Tax=Hydrocarboniphaga effusa TaxID=243629 RepID=UPI0035B4E2B3